MRKEACCEALMAEVGPASTGHSPCVSEHTASMLPYGRKCDRPLC